jgi:hypothetical protein
MRVQSKHCIFPAFSFRDYARSVPDTMGTKPVKNAASLFTASNELVRAWVRSSAGLGLHSKARSVASLQARACEVQSNAFTFIHKCECYGWNR